MKHYLLAAAAGLLLGQATLLAYPSLSQGLPVITQSGIAFKPAIVQVKAGGQVRFRNEDPFGHNVYSPSKGGVFDIGLQAPDTETAVTFREPGDYIIQCRIHPKMRAKVTVTP